MQKIHTFLLICLLALVSMNMLHAQEEIVWVPDGSVIPPMLNINQSLIEGTGMAFSAQTLKACENGTVDIVVNIPNVAGSYYTIGLAKASDPTNLLYGVQLEDVTSGVPWIYAAGSGLWTAGTLCGTIPNSRICFSSGTCARFADGDTLRITRTNNEMRFFHISTNVVLGAPPVPCELTLAGAPVIASPTEEWVVSYTSWAPNTPAISYCEMTHTDACDNPLLWIRVGEDEIRPQSLTDKVGIGTPIPTHELDVNGKVRIQDIPQDAASDKVLVEGANGVVSYRNKSDLLSGLGDTDWLTLSGQTPTSINDAIYTSGRVGIGNSNPQGDLHLNMSCNTAGVPGLRISQGICAWPVQYGDPIKVESSNGLTFQTDFTVTSGGRVGIGMEDPAGDLDIDGQGVLVLRAFSNYHCATRRPGLYFRKDFSPNGWANNPNELKNMSIRPRGVCSPSTVDGLEINGFDGIVLNTGYQDQLVVTGGGEVTIGFPAPECDSNTPGNCWTGIKLHVNGNTMLDEVLHSSDKRFKKDIEGIEKAMDKIASLNGVQYHFRTDFEGRNFSEGLKYGFIAQELEKVMPELTFQGTDGYYAVNYVAIIPLLTEALKEQQEQMEAQEDKLEAVEAELEALKAAVLAIQQGDAIKNGSKQAGEAATLEQVRLDQNAPNPFNRLTTIGYYLPGHVQQAALVVSDLKGKQLKQYKILKTGEGTIEINAGDLASGMYLYGLLVDGKMATTLKMVLTE